MVSGTRDTRRSLWFKPTATLVIFALGVAAAWAETSAALKNKLATVASPYLRDAATQPVAWQPWSDDAFRLAQSR